MQPSSLKVKQGCRTQTYNVKYAQDCTTATNLGNIT